MIAIILAAGRGSRLGHHTSDTPKSLLPLNEKGSILDYNLNLLCELGVRKILIVVGYQADKIRQHVSNRSEVEVIYNPFWEHCNVLGSLFMALPKIDDDFLFLHADTLVGIEAWKKLIVHKGTIILPYIAKRCGDEEMKVQLGPGNTLVRISKEIPHDEAHGEFLGIARFSHSSVISIQETATRLFETGNLNYYMEAVLQEFARLNTHDIAVFDIGNIPFVEIDFDNDYQIACKIFA